MHKHLVKVQKRFLSHILSQKTSSKIGFVYQIFRIDDNSCQPLELVSHCRTHLNWCHLTLFLDITRRADSPAVLVQQIIIWRERKSTANQQDFGKQIMTSDRSSLSHHVPFLLSQICFHSKSQEHQE